ncbi:helix-turn-helix transcriptional regulator [Labilibacter marinus]|uniref:helix-turn-helix transcriptional regulator n=1 Tax=Labilibacter marinus TaxID=1477105 RepID=UPI000832E11C|nr:helix-turn-helix domain-containing protein [Labilibacter marinus]
MDNIISLEERLIRIEKLLISQKRTLTFENLVDYTGFKPSYVYKLTSSCSIPHSKPGGGKLFFDKEAVDDWLLNSNKIPTREQLDQEASDYLLNRRR